MKKFLTSKTFGILGICAFALAAMGSSSMSDTTKKHVRDNVNSFIDGWEMGGGRSAVEIPDSLLEINSTSDYAMETN